MNEIAIASVAVQEWEKPYEIPKALWCGNIFPSLHKPFFIEEEMSKPKASPLSDSESKLLEIQQISFFLTDLTLFLDTHPNHAEAMTMKTQLQQKRKELLKQFAATHYPLTMDCQGEGEAEKAPWEGVNKNVGL